MDNTQEIQETQKSQNQNTNAQHIDEILASIEKSNKARVCIEKIDKELAKEAKEHKELFAKLQAKETKIQKLYAQRQELLK